MVYLYTVKVFNWDTNTYSNFKTFQSTAFVVMMLIGIPIMSGLLKWRDTVSSNHRNLSKLIRSCSNASCFFSKVIIMIGSISHASGRFFFAFARNPWVFCVGAAVASLGPCVAPVLRSMTSKTVPIEERGCGNL